MQKLAKLEDDNLNVKRSRFDSSKCVFAILEPKSLYIGVDLISPHKDHELTDCWIQRSMCITSFWQWYYSTYLHDFFLRIWSLHHLVTYLVEPAPLLRRVLSSNHPSPGTAGGFLCTSRTDLCCPQKDLWLDCSGRRTETCVLHLQLEIEQAEWKPERTLLASSWTRVLLCMDSVLQARFIYSNLLSGTNQIMTKFSSLPGFIVRHILTFFICSFLFRHATTEKFLITNQKGGPCRKFFKVMFHRLNKDLHYKLKKDMLQLTDWNVITCVLTDWNVLRCVLYTWLKCAKVCAFKKVFKSVLSNP